MTQRQSRLAKGVFILWRGGSRSSRFKLIFAPPRDVRRGKRGTAEGASGVVRAAAGIELGRERQTPGLGVGCSSLPGRPSGLGKHIAPP